MVFFIIASPPVAIPGIRRTFQNRLPDAVKRDDQNTPYYSLKENFFNAGGHILAAHQNPAIRLVDIAFYFIIKSG
jgi:hypothetical protein